LNLKTEMKEPVDDDRDLSHDNLFKKLYRRTTDYWYEAKKPTPRSEIPWWKPTSFNDGWFSRDPITEPRPKFPLSWDYQFKHTQPFLNLPVTDMLALPVCRQNTKCADLELKSLECMEYYGAQRGVVICQDYYDDWHECQSKNLQFLRLRMMQKQYMKKYFEYTRGERDYSTVYHQIPPPNAFEEPLRTKKNDFSDGHN